MVLDVKKMALAVMLSLVAAPPARAQQRDEVDRYIERVLVDWQIPGLAIAVVRNDSVLVAKGYGVRELGKPAPVNEHTVFDVASLAKSFTATAVAILVDRGVLRWDDPVRPYLPDLVLPTASLTDSATVRDFLSHRTGLDAANMMWVLTSVDRAEVLRRMRYVPVVAPARQRMVYSNVGYTVAGEAAAAAAGTTFEALLRDLVIKPLRLRSTTWTYEQAARMPNVAWPHATIAGRQQPIRREVQRQPIAAAAAVQSSAADLTRWMRLHLNDGVLDGTRFVSAASMREMHSIQVPIPTTPAMRAARLVEDSAVGYGMGWQVMDYRGHSMIWHTGNGDGQIAYMALLPRDRLGIAVLVNTWSAPFVHGALINRILDNYLGYPPRDWAGEARARVPAMVAARDSAERAMREMRDVAGPPPPTASYVGRYDHALFGPIIVRADSVRLTLQMGGGQVADLEFHGGTSFYTRWRDLLFRENFGTHVAFDTGGGSVTGFRVRINRDEFRAVRDTLPWRRSWPGTEMAVLSGDPRASGPFVFRFRMPDGYWICPHRHPITAHIRVISGMLLVGMGNVSAARRARALDAGGEIAIEPRMIHAEGARGETVLEIRGGGPWGITFVDPRDDPSAPGARGCRP